MNNKFITPILFLFGLASWPARGLSPGIPYGDSHKGYAPSIIENPRCLMNIVNSRKK